MFGAFKKASITQIDAMIQAAIQETSQHAHALIDVQLNLVDMAHLLTVVRLAAAHPEIDATHQHFALAFIRQCATVMQQQGLPATAALYLAAAPAPQTTYTLAADGNSITCRQCNYTSHNINDIQNRYCGYCHKFHEESRS
ncbi:MAG: hypothetical protein DYG89_03950 [Caldilinea sp. CFX5]|nr:hypothetical protein [Caldilinea sp. CFX5]